MPTAASRGIDQVVHTWLAPGIVAPHRFMDLDEDDVGGRVRAEPDRGVVVGPRRAPSRCEPAPAASCSSCPTVGMAGAAEFSMLAAVAEGVRVLAKGCGRQWGADGVTVNTIAAAPHHWVDARHRRCAHPRHLVVDARVRATPATPSTDLAPLIALLDDPDAHFLTAGTLVADGGTWMGL